jgi:hypothetical protein
MSKVGTDSSPSTPTIRKRSYWVRGALSPGSSKSTSPKAKTGKRFVAPYRLSDEQREALLASLQGQGLGDAESRALFAAALEYDLASCNALTMPAQEPEQGSLTDHTFDSDAALAQLGQAAATLADQISRLEAKNAKRLTDGLQSADRFNRGYGDDYFCSLRKELERIAAVVLTNDAVQGTEPLPKPALSVDARRFILRAADAFSECFAIAPTAQDGATFLSVIEAITAATGVVIPVDQLSLTEIIQHG